MALQRLLLVLTTCFQLTACDQSVDNVVLKENTSVHTTTKAVLLVIDGPRLMDTWGNNQRPYIPFQNQLAQEGVFFSNFYNDGDTYTLSGHTALVTGTYETMKNNGQELPDQPSVFQDYLASSQSAPTDAVLITSKSKLQALGNCKDNSWQGSYLPSVDAKDREDSVTLRVALTNLRDDHPTLSLIHFRGPDRKGHDNDWEGYLNSIQETDRYVKEVWDFIQTDPFYRDQTALFITNDHGRHLDGIGRGFVDHGDRCEGCRHISLLALGPEFTPGQVVESHYGQIDIAPTLATLLNFSWQGEGKAIEELISK